MAAADDLDVRPDLAAGAAAHPEEMRASFDLRIGDAVSLRATARATPAGLVAAAVLAAAIVLSVASLVRALRDPRGR